MTEQKPASPLDTILEALEHYKDVINKHAVIINKQAATIVKLHKSIEGLLAALNHTTQAITNLDTRLQKLEKKK
jgi:hypothetical protein